MYNYNRMVIPLVERFECFFELLGTSLYPITRTSLRRWGERGSQRARLTSVAKHKQLLLVEHMPRMLRKKRIQP